MKSEKTDKPKVLAPVSSLKMAEAVLKNGADIIYAGIKGWSLRPNMFEVTFEEMEQIIRLAKEYNREVFMAMNCLYRSTELAKAVEIIGKFKPLGLDGVIISEIGLIRAVREKFPQLQVHVSVQTSSSSSVDIDYFKSLGVTSVVLPRDIPDLSIDNIKAMAGRGVTLEIFVVGDDSTNYDGRCMLSGYLNQKAVPDEGTGRDKMILGSSNRCGYCFLMCKRECRIEDKKGRHLRRGDLSLHRRIPELLKAGVRVFKVQGRELPVHLTGKLTEAVSGALRESENREEFERYVSIIDDLVELKQIIASNHLWFLSKSKSPLWKKLRQHIEKPWDDLTGSLWTGSREAKKIIRKTSGLFKEKS